VIKSFQLHHLQVNSRVAFSLFETIKLALLFAPFFTSKMALFAALAFLVPTLCFKLICLKSCFAEE
jgi:hypothetical protein